MRTAGQGRPPGKRRTPSVKQRLLEAYTALFVGHGSKEDAQMVLTDLATFSGFFQVAPPGTGSDALQYAEGQRSVFGHIFGNLNLPNEEREALYRAALSEAITNHREGEL